MCRKGAPKAPQRDYLFVPEIGENGHFRDLGPSWGLDGGPDSQNYQNDLPNDPWDTQIQQTNINKQTNSKKMAGVTPCISYFWGVFRQAEYRWIQRWI